MHLLSKKEVFNICQEEIDKQLSFGEHKSQIFGIIKFFRRDVGFGVKSFQNVVYNYMNIWTGDPTESKSPISMREYMRKYCYENLDDDWLTGIKTYVENEIKKIHNPASLVRMMIFDTIERMSKKIVNEGHKNTMLRTGEFHHYLNRPMGQNEFVLEIAKNDIFNFEKIEVDDKKLIEVKEMNSKDDVDYTPEGELQ